MLSEEKVKSIMHDFVGAMAKGDVEKCVSLCAEDVVWLLPEGTFRGREGFEGGIYDLNEARTKVNSYLEVIKKAKQEIERIRGITGDKNSRVDVGELKKELERLAQENLDKATFNEKRDIMNKLGIGVYPSEDLKTMKIRCNLNPENGQDNHSPDGCVIIQFASLRSQ